MQQRKPKVKRKKRKKKSLLNIFVALLLFCFSILSISRVTSFGTLAANELRIVFGDTYIFICWVLFFYAFLFFILGKEPRARDRMPIFACFLVYLGILLLITGHHYHEFLMGSQEPYRELWKLMMVDLQKNQIEHSFGGGFFGLSLYLLLKKIMVVIPVGFVAMIIVIIGLMLLFRKQLSDLQRNLLSRNKRR